MWQRQTNLRIPVAIIQNDSVSSCQVETQATRSGTKKEYEDWWPRSIEIIKRLKKEGRKRLRGEKEKESEKEGRKRKRVSKKKKKDETVCEEKRQDEKQQTAQNGLCHWIGSYCEDGKEINE